MRHPLFSALLPVLALLIVPACSREPEAPPAAAASGSLHARSESASAPNPAADAKPSPALSSEDVVRYQMLALQHADQPSPDAGVEIAFRFASPQNRVHTGPIERFATIVRAPGYAPMINCDAFEIAEGDEVEADGQHVAQHLVIVHAADGSTLQYLFQLRRQPGSEAGAPANEYADCWMVEGVMPVRPLPPTPDANPPPPAPAPAPPPGRIAT